MITLSRIDTAQADWLHRLLRELNVLHGSLNQATFGRLKLASSILQIGHDEVPREGAPTELTEVRVATFLDTERNELPIFDPQRATRVYYFCTDGTARMEYMPTPVPHVHSFRTPQEALDNLREHLAEGLPSLSKPMGITWDWLISVGIQLRSTSASSH